MVFHYCVTGLLLWLEKLLGCQATKSGQRTFTVVALSAPFPTAPDDHLQGERKTLLISHSPRKLISDFLKVTTEAVGKESQVDVVIVLWEWRSPPKS